MSRRINTAVELLSRYGRIENFPSNVLSKQRKLALLFSNLATLRTDPPFSRTSKSCAGAVRPLRSPRRSWKKKQKCGITDRTDINTIAELIDFDEKRRE